MTEKKTKIKNTENKKEKMKNEKPKKESKVDSVKTDELQTNEILNTKTEEETLKSEDKKEKKEKSAPVIKKKEEAVANGYNLPVSKKQCMYICNFIKNKKIDSAISDLEDVLKFKKAVPFKGEIPHRKGNIMSGRYPLKASKIMIKLLKGLKGNVIVNLMDLEKTRIDIASANDARRPSRKGGTKFKRTNVFLIARESSKNKQKEKKMNQKHKEKQ